MTKKKRNSGDAQRTLGKNAHAQYGSPLTQSVADDHLSGANNGQHACVSATDTAIGLIRGHYRDLMFVRKQRISITNRTGAYLRRQFGWSLDAPEKERKKIERRVAAVMADPTGTEWVELIEMTRRAVEPFEAIEARHEKAIATLVETLPVWHSFGAAVKGLSSTGLGHIIGMAGNLGDYATKSKLYKRLGLAVIDGMRQGSPGPNPSSDDWIRHGYNRRRRSEMFVIGDKIIYQQVRKDGTDCPHVLGRYDVAATDETLRCSTGRYGDTYLRRKQLELGRVATAKSTGLPNKGHADFRARRYMEKLLVKDLWLNWRQVMPSEACSVVR